MFCGQWYQKLVLWMQILRAISDGLDCRGYYIWTLVDKYAPALVHRMPYAICLLVNVLCTTVPCYLSFALPPRIWCSQTAVQATLLMTYKI